MLPIAATVSSAAEKEAEQEAAAKISSLDSD